MMPPSRHMMNYSVNPSYHNTKTNEQTENQRTSFCLLATKGSITIEAAFAIPLFFLAVLALFYMMEVMSIRTSVRNGMQYAAKRAAEDCYLTQMVSPSVLETGMSMLTGILEMEVTYQVKLPIPVFAAKSVHMKETMRMKGWNGYQSAFWDKEDNETVYITETGMVYHRDYHCNYLELSIRTVNAGTVDDLRNNDQEKYHPCDKCVHGSAASQVYLTDYGNRYHNSLSCSGLKRTVYAIPVSEAVGKGACTKCSK